MKNKKEYFDTLNSIQEMVSHVRTLNEAIQFGDEYDDADMAGTEAQDNPEQEMPMSPEGNDFAEGGKALGKIDAEEPDPEEGLRELGEVDQIREIALRGMIKLCKNPEDDRYQALKKIFQFCDKAAENKDKENPQA
jgi:hypothetical protein